VVKEPHKPSHFMASRTGMDRSSPVKQLPAPEAHTPNPADAECEAIGDPEARRSKSPARQASATSPIVPTGLPSSRYGASLANTARTDATLGGTSPQRRPRSPESVMTADDKTRRAVDAANRRVRSRAESVKATVNSIVKAAHTEEFAALLQSLLAEAGNGGVPQAAPPGVATAGSHGGGTSLPVIGNGGSNSGAPTLPGSGRVSHANSGSGGAAAAPATAQ
jgi:hypothetical protein